MDDAAVDAAPQLASSRVVGARSSRVVGAREALAAIADDASETKAQKASHVQTFLAHRSPDDLFEEFDRDGSGEIGMPPPPPPPRLRRSRGILASLH